MKIHDLKITPDNFDPVYTGIKTAELRINDRDFKVYDVLKLREFDNGHYTGSTVWRRVTCVTPVDFIAPNYVMLSIIPASHSEIVEASACTN
ncbi:DUF3850 domain-containing protein [Hafnia alvei]|uniref:DUF3850 domain-containing protein n=1 Tax=Hafnia alvei TaxID=569 RepID=UPI002DBE6C66|nr:DUF3850 domain-containing protein [Hafnia alvei]MEB7891022.1 DUF3850 domain-containing protein [Hafnia alvei]